MKRYTFFPIFILALLFSTNAFASDNFTNLTYETNSKYRMDFEDWDRVLKYTVLNMGRSERRIPRANTGSISRLAKFKGNLKPSRHEGNRVFFHDISNGNIQHLEAIRLSMQSIPDKVSLNAFSRNEQLAFWFNLHNIAVYEQIARRYPTIQRMDKVIFGKKRCAFVECASSTSIWHEKFINVSGEQLSIADIEEHVLSNWNSPLIIYGFYFGAVGTPNLRIDAFQGNDIWYQLEDNAREFINSFRGVRTQRKTLKVSTYYESMAQVFPDFNRDIKRHVAEYADARLKAQILKTSKVKASLSDWHIADIYNGRPDDDKRFTIDNSHRYINNEIIEIAIKRFRKRKTTVDVEEIRP